MFISQAYAQTAQTAQQAVESGLPEGVKVLIQILLIFFVLYFLLIRPQQAKLKEHQARLNAIIIGSKIVVSGIVGVVKSIKEDELTVEVAPDVEIKVLREYVSQVYLNESNKSDSTKTKKGKK